MYLYLQADCLIDMLFHSLLDHFGYCLFNRIGNWTPYFCSIPRTSYSKSCDCFHSLWICPWYVSIKMEFRSLWRLQRYQFVSLRAYRSNYRSFRYLACGSNIKLFVGIGNSHWVTPALLRRLQSINLCMKAS